MTPFIQSTAQYAGQFAIQNWQYTRHPIISGKVFWQLPLSHKTSFLPAIIHGISMLRSVVALPALLVRIITNNEKAAKPANKWLEICGIQRKGTKGIAKEISAKIVNDIAVLAILTWLGQASKNLPFGFFVPSVISYAMCGTSLEGKVVTKPCGWLIESTTTVFSKIFINKTVTANKAV